MRDDEREGASYQRMDLTIAGIGYRGAVEDLLADVRKVAAAIEQGEVTMEQASAVLRELVRRFEERTDGMG
jgi:polyhydroxyalkanoate synthesis regulator phasin